MAAHYRELIPNANVTELVGHYPQVQAPAQVIEAYLEFRDEIARSPSAARAPTSSRQSTSN
jgi:hypothetical protein